MKKYILIFSAILFSGNSNSCKLNNEYLYSFNLNKSVLKINIERKDNRKINFYDIYGTKGRAYLGFRFTDGKKLIKGRIDTFMIRGNDDFLINKFYDLLVEKNTLISPTLSSGDYSQSYKVPLEDNFKKEIKKLSYNINIDTFTSDFNDLMVDNNIYGKQNIKFYVKLITTSNLECVYFESNEIIYNFPNKSWINIIKDSLK